MDDPSLLPFLNNNGNGHHYSLNIDDDIEHEEDELEEEDDDDNIENQEEEEEEEGEDVLQNYDQIQQYPEDEIDEDEIEEDDIDEEENQDEQEMVIVQPPPQAQQQQQQQQTIQSERGGRRKGVPRRLQLSPQIIKSPAPQQRLLPLSLSKSTSSVHHHDQPILTSDQEDINEINDDFNNENHIDEYFHNKQSNSIELELLSKHLINNGYDENNNNNNYHDEEDDILEIVDDLLAEIVTKIVKDVRKQRQKHFKPQINPAKTNGYSNHKPSINGLSKSIHKQEQKMTNGKHHMNNNSIPANSIKSSKSSSKLSDSSSLLFNEFTKMMHLNSQQQLVKQKHSSSTFSSPPSAKRQKTSETLTSSQPTTPSSMQQQHQQLLWQMTQQLIMSGQATDADTSSLLKQQLLGLTPPGTIIPKRVGRPPKQQTQPQIMRSSTNMIPPTSTNTSSFERGNFAPRRRGRPPKYVTERVSMPGLSSHDLDPSSSYDQLFAAIENSVTGNSSRTSSAAFQSALASMLGHQAGLSLPLPIPPSGSVVRNGTPASMVKQSAGQTRHSLPAPSTATKLSHTIGGTGNGLDMPLMAAKKRGPGRPPKTQLLLDSHPVLQATKRINSSSSLANNSSNNNNNNNFPPTMVPSSPTSFNLNAAFVDMLQQQHHSH